eukprot:10572580-Lingulodinium_polyedra.AAC.1
MEEEGSGCGSGRWHGGTPLFLRLDASLGGKPKEFDSRPGRYPSRGLDGRSCGAQNGPLHGHVVEALREGDEGWPMLAH